MADKSFAAVAEPEVTTEVATASDVIKNRNDNRVTT